MRRSSERPSVTSTPPGPVQTEVFGEGSGDLLSRDFFGTGGLFEVDCYTRSGRGQSFVRHERLSMVLPERGPPTGKHRRETKIEVVGYYRKSRTTGPVTITLSGPNPLDPVRRGRTG